MYLLAPLYAIIHFSKRWLMTRKWHYFSWSLPAVGLSITLGVLITAQRMVPVNQKAARIAERAAAAERAQDYDNAEFLYRKALRLQPDSVSVRYSRACLLETMEKNNEAAEAMFELASLTPDGVSWPAAHEWIATAVRDERINVPKEHRQELIESHSRKVVATGHKNVAARWVLAEAALKRGDQEDAIEHLPYVVEEMPLTRIHYAKALLDLGQTEMARLQARNAIRFYESITKEHSGKSKIQAGLWFDWATAALILNEFNEALQVLDRGATLAKEAGDDIKFFRYAAGEVVVLWTRDIERNAPNNIADQLELLGSAIQTDPGSPALLTRIAELAGQSGDTPTVAVDLLRSSLADGTAPGIVHFILGTNAATRGDLDSARNHLQLAARTQPNTAVILNNLAWTLAHDDNADIGRALQLANEAVQMDSENGQIRETRGQILMQLQRWQEGIEELEFALRRITSTPEIHQALAAAYEQLGDTQMAAHHTARLQKLISTKKWVSPHSS